MGRGEVVSPSAVARQSFDPAPYGERCLRLQVGDVIVCLWRRDGWMFGKRVNPRWHAEILAEGWFPADRVLVACSTVTAPPVYKVVSATMAFDPVIYGGECMRLQKGDRIVAYEKSSRNWMYGMRVNPRCQGEILAFGWFPSNFTVHLAEPEECYELALAIIGFDAGQYGGEYMQLKRGDAILAYQKLSEDWMYGMRVNPFCYIEILARGWFPPDFIAYVLEPGEFGDA